MKNTPSQISPANRLDVGLKRSEVAQRDFAFGLNGLQPIGSDGLDLVQSLGSGDVRLFMPGDLRCGLGDAFLLHRQFRDGGVALDSRGFQPGGKVRPFGSEGRGGAGTEQPANDKANKKREDKEKSGQTVHEGSFLERNRNLAGWLACRKSDSNRDICKDSAKG